MRNFKNKAQDKLETFAEIMIEYRVNPKLPCKSLMEQAKKNLEELLAIKEPVEFFKTVDKKRDDLLDDADDTAPVFDFFKGGQKKIFEKHWNRSRCLKTVRPTSVNRKSWIMLPRWKLL